MKPFGLERAKAGDAFTTLNGEFEYLFMAPKKRIGGKAYKIEGVTL